MKPSMPAKPRQAIPGAASFSTNMGKTYQARGGLARKTGPIMAVPKPINLPSRRAENNGFDPNVQLVPGGSWAAPTGKAAAQNAASAANGPSPKAEAQELLPASSASKAAWSVQQPVVAPRPTVSTVSADFPKLGVVPTASTAAAVVTNRFQPAAPQRSSQPVQPWREEPSLNWRDEPPPWREDTRRDDAHTWRDDPPQNSWRDDTHQHNWREETPHNWRDDSRPVPRGDEPHDRPRYTGAYQPPSFRNGQSNQFYSGDRSRTENSSGFSGYNSYGGGSNASSSNYGYSGASSAHRFSAGGPSFGSRAWAEDDEGEMDFRQPIVIPATAPGANAGVSSRSSMNGPSESASGGAKAGTVDNSARNTVRLLDPVEEARLLAKRKQLELERMEQQLLEQQRRAEQELQERERKEEERRRQEAQRKAAEEAQARAAEEARIAEERRRRMEQERLEEQRRNEERRREEEMRREEEARALKREEERMLYRNQPQLMKQSIDLARQRRQQEEERMAAERKVAAEQKLRALEDRCALRERELREREEREAREREEREAREREEREARERSVRESRERRERERRQQQDEAAAAAALEQQQRRDQHRVANFESRDGSGSPPSPLSPRGEWAGSRRGPGAPGGETGRSRPYINGTGQEGLRKQEWEQGGEGRSAWSGGRRDGPADYQERKPSGYGGVQRGDRTGDFGEGRGPRKLFDPKQNRFVTEDEEPGFLRREMAQREEAERQKREASSSQFGSSIGRETFGRNQEQRFRHDERRTKDPAERAMLKAEALVERRRREQDRKEFERREQAAISNAAGKEESLVNPPRPRVPAPPRQAYREQTRPASEEFFEGSDAADRPRSAPASRQRSHAQSAGSDQQAHHQPVHNSASSAGTRRKEDGGRRDGAGSNSTRASQFQASVDASPQPPLKDLDLTFGGELLISNSTIGAGVGGLRFGQSVGTSGRDPWAVDPASERDSWDNWNPAQSAASLKPPAWGATDNAAPPPASLNQIMLEERLAEQRQAAVAVPATTATAATRPGAKGGTRPAPARARGGSTSVRSGGPSAARNANERTSGGDRDAEADPNKVASEVATGTADFILGGEDESGVVVASLDPKFSPESGGGTGTSKVSVPYDGAARWEKAVGAVGTWDPWDMNKIGYSAGFGGAAGDNSAFSAARLSAQPPLGLGFLPLQQPMWATDNSLWSAPGPSPARTPLAGQSVVAGTPSASSAKVSVGQVSPAGQGGGRGKDFARAQNQSQPPPQLQQSQQSQGQRNQAPRQQGKPGGGVVSGTSSDNSKRVSGKKGGNNQKQQDVQDRQQTNNIRRSDPVAASVRRSDAGVKIIEPLNPAISASAGTQPPRPARGGHRGGPPRNTNDGQSPAAERLNATQQQQKQQQQQPQQQQQQQQRPVSARTDGRKETLDNSGRASRAPRARQNRASADTASGSRDGAGTPQGRGQQ